MNSGAIYIIILKVYKVTDVECRDHSLHLTESYCAPIFIFLHNHRESFFKEVKGECRSSFHRYHFVCSACFCFQYSYESNKHVSFKLQQAGCLKLVHFTSRKILFEERQIQFLSLEVQRCCTTLKCILKQLGLALTDTVKKKKFTYHLKCFLMACF